MEVHLPGDSRFCQVVSPLFQFVYLYLLEYTSVCLPMCLRVSMYTCVFLCICIRVHVPVYLPWGGHDYVSVVCMCVCAHMHGHLHVLMRACILEGLHPSFLWLC